MTNQELKEKLLEEFDSLSFNNDDATLKIGKIKALFSNTLDALLLSEDEVIDVVSVNTWSNCRELTKALIDTQRDKLITKG
jgi:hypothetical protein